MSKAPFFVSLGANLGDRFHSLKTALIMMGQIEGTRLNAISSIYETDPVGLVEQPAFLNLVAGGETILSAEELLSAVLKVEQELGRKREIRWGPRTLDIDILIYGEEQRDDELLQIPHPRMKERLFVLIPFVEIAPKQLVPVADTYKTTTELLEKVNDKSGVRKWKDIDWETELELSEN